MDFSVCHTPPSLKIIFHSSVYFIVGMTPGNFPMGLWCTELYVLYVYMYCIQKSCIFYKLLGQSLVMFLYNGLLMWKTQIAQWMF